MPIPKEIIDNSEGNKLISFLNDDSIEKFWEPLKNKLIYIFLKPRKDCKYQDAFGGNI
ncbi:MAG: hypothetical protein DDT33_00405 [Firmicutes bacterium]|nr:hypothetical protein [Bacillota bacterium]